MVTFWFICATPATEAAIPTMAYDEGLAQRIRKALDDRPGIAERKMFGGLCFGLNGNMACGVTGDELMVRVGPDGHADALKRPHACKRDFTGRPYLCSSARRRSIPPGFKIE